MAKLSDMALDILVTTYRQDHQDGEEDTPGHPVWWELVRTDLGLRRATFTALCDELLQAGYIDYALTKGRLNRGETDLTDSTISLTQQGIDTCKAFEAECARGEAAWLQTCAEGKVKALASMRKQAAELRESLAALDVEMAKLAREITAYYDGKVKAALDA